MSYHFTLLGSPHNQKSLSKQSQNLEKKLSISHSQAALTLVPFLLHSWLHHLAVCASSSWGRKASSQDIQTLRTGKKKTTNKVSLKQTLSFKCQTFPTLLSQPKTTKPTSLATKKHQKVPLRPTTKALFRTSLGAPALLELARHVLQLGDLEVGGDASPWSCKQRPSTRSRSDETNSITCKKSFILHYFLVFYMLFPTSRAFSGRCLCFLENRLRPPDRCLWHMSSTIFQRFRGWVLDGSEQQNTPLG